MSFPSKDHAQRPYNLQSTDHTVPVSPCEGHGWDLGAGFRTGICGTLAGRVPVHLPRLKGRRIDCVVPVHAHRLRRRLRDRYAVFMFTAKAGMKAAGKEVRGKG